MARGISQEGLAFDADVDRGYVSGIERRTFNPTVDVLDRLAQALAVDISELFTQIDADEMPPVPLRGGRRKT